MSKSRLEHSPLYILGQYRILGQQANVRREIVKMLDIGKGDPLITQLHRVRIELTEGGQYSFMDVTNEGPITYDLEARDIDPEHMKKLSLLMLVDPATEVLDVGYRYDDKVFYINAE